MFVHFWLGTWLSFVGCSRDNNQYWDSKREINDYFYGS